VAPVTNSDAAVLPTSAPGEDIIEAHESSCCIVGGGPGVCLAWR